jgi:hypothetical protein
MSDPKFDRPGKARALLADPLFIEAFETVENAIHEKWAETATYKKDELHELKLMLSVVKNVRKSIEAVAREGKSELHRAKQPSFLGEIREIWNKPKRAN